jgi:hypothetical protein
MVVSKCEALIAALSSQILNIFSGIFLGAGSQPRTFFLVYLGTHWVAQLVAIKKMSLATNKVNTQLDNRYQ